MTGDPHAQNRATCRWHPVPCLGPWPRVMVKAKGRSGARQAAVVGEGLTHSSILCDLAFRTPRVFHPTLHHAYPEQQASSWECGAGEAACGGGWPRHPLPGRS